MIRCFALIITIATFNTSHSNIFNTINKPISQESIQELNKSLRNTSVFFEENKGQVSGRDAASVNFFYKNSNMTVFLLRNGISYQFERMVDSEFNKFPERYRSIEKGTKLQGNFKQPQRETYRMDIVLKESNPSAEILSIGCSNDYIHYYNKGVMDVHSYEKIIYKNIYPNIDWIVYVKENDLKYDFVVHPGGNFEDIRLEIKDAENIFLNEDGSLCLQNRMGSICEQKPISFQNHTELNTRFIQRGDFFSFAFDSTPDPNTPLVIDPLVRLWGRYYGGSGTDLGLNCTTDKSGNFYLAGVTSSATEIAENGYKNSASIGPVDAFLVKFSPTGVRQWGTYYGGERYEFSSFVKTDKMNNVYLCGHTNSTIGIGHLGHDTSLTGESDAYLVKFDSSGRCLWGTYYGGNYSETAYSCAIDTIGNVYLAGGTNSTTNIALAGSQNTLLGQNNGFVVKFDGNGNRIWGTYIGGNQGDYITSVSIDKYNYIYLAGRTNSTSGISLNGYQDTLRGVLDLFLFKLNPSGTKIWGTYFGGEDSEFDNVLCAVDSLGFIYLSGSTKSTTGIASRGYQDTLGGYYDAFLARYNSNGNLMWSTYYGGTGDDFGKAICLDDSGYIYIAGYTSSNGLGFKGYKNSKPIGGEDAYIAKFNSKGQRVRATYYGGHGHEQGLGVAIDKIGNLFLSGFTESDNSDNQVASFEYTNTYGGFNANAFIVKLFDSPCTFINHFIYDTICVGQSKSFKGINLTNAGLYRDTLINNIGCDSILILNLFIRPILNPVANISTSKVTVCKGDTVVFMANFNHGGTSPIYQWKLNGVNVGTNKNVYSNLLLSNNDEITCMMTSNALCANPISSISNKLIIKVNPLPKKPQIKVSGNVISTLSSAASYQWSINNIAILGNNQKSYIAQKSAYYQVKITDSLGCSIISDSIKYGTNAIHTLDKTFLFNILPNPSSGHFNIHLLDEKEITRIEIHDTRGSLIKRIENIENNNVVNIYTKGVYFVSVIDEKGKKQIEKIEIN